MTKPKIIRRHVWGFFVCDPFAPPHSEIYAGMALPPRAAFDRTITREQLDLHIKGGRPFFVCRTNQNN